MKSSKNIHVLATPNPSRLFYLASNLHLEQGQLISPKNYQNIYITSDEEIKEGDKSLLFVDGFEPMILTHFEPVEEGYEGKKIILTTDQDLDGVQAINDEFLEWFVKNPSCEEVEVKYSYPTIDDEGDGSISEGYWLLIIPKEEPKFRFDNINIEEPTIKEIKNHKAEPKQETLEVVKDLTYYRNNAEEDYLGVPISVLRYIDKLEKQQQNMYSEEEVIILLQKYRYDLSSGKTPNIGDTTAFWFAQNKKK